MMLTRWRRFCEMGEGGMTRKDGLLTPGKIKIPTQLLLYQENVSVPRFFFLPCTSPLILQDVSDFANML